jgi:hypothetical protein
MYDSDPLRQHIALAPIRAILTPESVHEQLLAVPSQPQSRDESSRGLVVDNNGTGCSFLKAVLRRPSDALP